MSKDLEELFIMSARVVLLVLFTTFQDQISAITLHLTKEGP